MILVNKNPNKRGKYGNAKTSTYHPINKQKYIGTEDPIFKSNLERKMMIYLDRSQSIAWWKYEPEYIAYVDNSSNPPRRRKYYIDFKFQDVKGQIYWVEIKPYSETIPSNGKDIRNVKIWLKNKSKWDAARLIAESRGYKFKILTEKELN